VAAVAAAIRAGSTAPYAIAPIVIAKPASCVGDSDSPSAIQPSAAPVIGAARPSSGGAAEGRRRMPLNQTTYATAVPPRVR